MMDIERQDFMKEGNREFYSNVNKLVNGELTFNEAIDTSKSINDRYIKSIDLIELEAAKAMFSRFNVPDPTIDELISLDKLFNEDNK